MKIYVSGLYSGTNPQPGVGVIRSLRAAYPDSEIIGVEYSNRCSGIHWHELDDIWLQSPWEQMDLESYRLQIQERLNNGGFWVSGVDLEIMWLAAVFPDGHPHLLTPPRAALARISKPEVSAHRGLPVEIPDFISTEEPDWDLHSFCREHGWNVWLKGPYYEAYRTNSWAALEGLRTVLSRAWSTDRLFLQAHVTGYEESICFCAYRGELIESVYMRKRELTEEGKTWAGDVNPVPPEFLEPLRRIVAELNWTGGAELEMVRDLGDQLWLLECNPRFPAWIHGATITGHNLPALLLERASGRSATAAAIKGEQFTRVVLEIPVKADFPLPSLPEPYPRAIGHSMKHPSGTLALAERLQKLQIIEGRANNGDACDGHENGNGHKPDLDDNFEHVVSPLVPESFLIDISNHEFDRLQTPAPIFLQSTAEQLFDRAAKASLKLSTPAAKVSNAYSIKTNPDERLLRLALESGFLAEAISLLEVQKALDLGFKGEQIILNGPGKWWPAAIQVETVHAVFADSLSDFRRIAGNLKSKQLHAKFAGIRLRPPNVASRFGVAIDSPAAFKELVEAIQLLPRDAAFGIHFHMASSNIGVRQWWHLYESMIRWARSIEAVSHRPIECLDIGGGWFPDDWHDDAADKLAAAIQRATRMLPAVREIISEPGKAMAQPSCAIAMRVLEFSESDGQIKEAVVDGSIAELPMHFVQPHRILHRNSTTGALSLLKRGETNLFGRLCMEHDVVAANVQLPPKTQTGDVLIFCDAGGYDRSMAYAFGQG